MNKFEELLAKYGKTADEVTFEYENLSDEELEVAFKEAFEETKEEPETVEEPVVEEVVEDPVDENHIDETPEEPAEESAEEPEVVIVEEAVEESIEQPEEKFVLKYELSHDDIRSALYSLLSVESEDNSYYTWILEVYDDKFIYQDYIENKFYRRSYSKDGENVSLGENKVEVFNEWLSKAEKDALDALKEDYAILKEFKSNTEAAQLQAQKDTIFAREEYTGIKDTKAFKKLVENSKNYTVEECEQRANDILEDCNSFVTNFAVKDDTKKPKTLGFSVETKNDKKKKAYGKLFD